MAELKFTLGECNMSGKNYRFDYENGKYNILLVTDENSKILETIEDKVEAYAKWNEIKRPEKAKKV